MLKHRALSWSKSTALEVAVEDDVSLVPSVLPRCTSLNGIQCVHIAIQTTHNEHRLAL